MEEKLQTVKASQGHILVADDDPGVRYVVQWALENDGLEVRTATNGDEAVDSIAEALPRLLVLDLTMPQGSGSEVAGHLRARDAKVPILVVTGDGQAAEKASSVGAYEYLHKPFEIVSLVSAVRRGLD